MFVEYFFLLPYPFLVLFHYLGDHDVIVFRMYQKVVVNGIGQNVGLDQIQSIVCVVSIMKFYSVPSGLRKGVN